MTSKNDKNKMRFEIYHKLFKRVKKYDTALFKQRRN